MTSRRPHPSRSSRTIWRLLEDAGSHEFNGQSGCCRCCCWAADSGPDCHPAAVTWPVTETALFPRPRQARKCGPRLKRKISAESKGCWWSTFGADKVSDVPKFSQALYLFPPPFFAPSTNWNSCSPLQSYKKILQKDILLKKKNTLWTNRVQITAYCKNNTFV